MTCCVCVMWPGGFESSCRSCS